MQAVHHVFPNVKLDNDDIELVYSGVRPLPASGPTTPAAITRKHWLEQHPGSCVPWYSIIGGKLTTCRSLAEDAAATILKQLGYTPSATSRDRPLPGAHAGAHGAPSAHRSIVPDVSLGQCATAHGDRAQLLDNTPYPIELARYMVEHEWVKRLDDFVERRLMLLYHRPLTRKCLEQLANVLVDARLLDAGSRQLAVEATIARLSERFGKRVVTASTPAPLPG
jgi:glycerol-3-phosphate dehydrogenase